MALSEKDIKQITDFVKKEPRTVQDIAKLIGRSWVTTDSYLQQMEERTGLIKVKTFRKGSQGALKVVYFNSSESLAGDGLREELFSSIKAGRAKTDFDFMEIYQYVEAKKKRHLVVKSKEGESAKAENLSQYFKETKSRILIFSGNLSFINRREGKKTLLDLIEECVERGVQIRIICRINIASLSNIHKLKPIMAKHPGSIEIKHRYQPLRGFIFDDRLAQFKNEEQLKLYRIGELDTDMKINYEIYDTEWIEWLEKVFWALYRTSIDYEQRVKEIRKISDMAI